jgi:FMN phosphatase YigB (HAD superfamily)
MIMLMTPPDTPNFEPLPVESYPIAQVRPGIHIHTDALKTAHTINRVLERASSVDDHLWTMDPKEMLRRIAPADGENYRPLGHCLATGRFARYFAEKLGLDADLAERAGIMHDAGRWVNVHRYHRNDVVGNLLLRRLGLHAQVEEVLQPSSASVLPENYRFIDTFTPMQRITILADICGRPTDSGDLLPFEKTIERHFATRVEGSFETPWPSERVARSVLTDDVVQQWGRIYMNLAYWMAEQGVDIEQVRQSFMEQDANAPVDTIIFDVGGVLIGDTDPPVIADFCRELSITEDELNTACADIITPLQTGAMNEEQFWDAFGEKLGKVIPASQRDLFTRSFNPTMDPRMKDLIQRLKDDGKKLLVLSDTIPPHVRALTEAGVYDGFDEVLTSPEIRCSKKAGSAFQGNSELAPFVIAALHAGKPQQGCLFIDDKQKYVDLAQNAQMKGVRFTSFEQLEQDLRERGVLR